MKLLVTSNFSFSHNVFHSYISLVRQNAVLCGNRLTVWLGQSEDMLFSSEQIFGKTDEECSWEWLVDTEPSLSVSDTDADRCVFSVKVIRISRASSCYGSNLLSVSTSTVDSVHTSWSLNIKLYEPFTRGQNVRPCPNSKDLQTTLWPKRCNFSLIWSTTLLEK